MVDVDRWNHSCKYQNSLGVSCYSSCTDQKQHPRRDVTGFVPVRELLAGEKNFLAGQSSKLKCEPLHRVASQESCSSRFQVKK